MNRLLYSMMALALFVCCDDALVPEKGDVERCSEVLFSPSIYDGTSAETRGSISGTTFPVNSTYGIFVTCHDPVQTPPDDYLPHQIGTLNMKATRTWSEWRYTNTVINATFNTFYLTSRTDSLTADIYAYAPFIDSLSRPDSIPFLHSKNRDMMWAGENSSPTENKNIQPDGTTKTVNLTFRHVLARLRFNFKTENSGSNHRMDYITILKTGSGTTSLYESGIFNAIDGTFSEMTEASDSLCVESRDRYEYFMNNESFSSNTSYTPFDVLLYPTQLMADDDLTVVFGIDGFRHSYVLKRSDVEHRDAPDAVSGNGTYGFAGGYTYTFNFIFDNYVHLKNIEIQSDWTGGSVNFNI